MTTGGEARWSTVKRVLADALELPPDERAGFLDAVCGGDRGLRAEVQALLLEHESEGPLDAMADALQELTGPAPSLAPGDRAGRFRIVRELGRGGMGTVYLAEREGADFEQRVAIKVVDGGPSKAELANRLRSERRILAGLDHPGIARFLDGDVTAAGLPYLVMEYVQGTPIDRYADELSLSVEARLAIFERVLDAVRSAHQRLVVHQDIKPSNILIRADGSVKLLDFGVASLLGDDTSPRSGRAWHTPGYSSPELRRGEPATLASDVYSLGVLLHVLLTGVSPDQVDGRAASDLSIANEVAAARGTTARRLKRRLRGDLDAILQRALASDPTQRYGTADVLRHELRSHLDARPVQARAGGRAYRASRFMRRNRLAVGGAAAVGVVLLAGLASTTTQARRAEEQARIAAYERDLSQQVSDLLIAMFEISDPNVRLGETITAREILDRAAEDVESRLSGQPEAQARLLREIGRVYHNLGLHEPARAAASRSLEAYQGLGRERSQEAVDVMRLLASATVDAGDPIAAADLLEDAIAVLRSSSPNDRQVLAATLSEHAALLRIQARYPEAESAWSEALDLLGPDIKDEALETEVRFGLALARHDQGDFDAAEERFREVVALLPEAAAAGLEGPVAAQSRHQLGQLLMIRGQYEEAETLLKEALAVQDRLLEPEHADRLSTMQTLATLRVNSGRAREALPLMEQVFELRSQSLGSAHPDVARSQFGLGGTLLNLGREREAATFLRGALEVYLALFGRTHPYVIQPAFALSRATLALGDLDAAQEAAEISSAASNASFGEDHPYVLQSLTQLGRLAAARGTVDSATVLHERAFRRGVELFGVENRIVIQAQTALGQHLLSQGAAARAEVLLREAEEAASDLEGPTSLLATDAGFALGQALVVLGRSDEATNRFASALRVREAAFPADHPAILEAREELARLKR